LENLLLFPKVNDVVTHSFTALSSGWIIIFIHEDWQS
jgi:hypothetical protein